MEKGCVVQKKKMSNRRKRGIKYFLMAVPFMIFLFAFAYIPLFGWGYAFVDYKIGHGILDSQFVGLKHFRKLFNDTDVLRVLRNTLAMSFLGLLSSPLPALFAIMLNAIKGRRVKKAVQTLTTLPNFISWIVVFGIAYQIFSNSGLLNQLLELLHLSPIMMGLIGDGDHVWFFQLGLAIWKSLGWNSIIYLAAIAGIDQELYDAARVDGANKLQLERYITVPGLVPTFLVLLLLSVSNLLNNGFEQYYVFWNSLVSDKIEVLDYYVYNLGFGTGQYSYSIAVGMTKSLISILLLFTVNAISKKVRGSSMI